MLALKHVLQFVEEGLASGIHVSSNLETFNHLQELSGHASRLNKYSILHAETSELVQFPFFKSENVQKLGGHMGQIHKLLKDLVPIAKERNTNLLTNTQEEIIEQIVQGKIAIPEEKLKEIKIKNESELMLKTFGKHFEDPNFNLRLMLELLNSLTCNNETISPKSISEIIICEMLVKDNILNHSLDDVTNLRGIDKSFFMHLNQQK